MKCMDFCRVKQPNKEDFTVVKDYKKLGFELVICKDILFFCLKTV